MKELIQKVLTLLLISAVHSQIELLFQTSKPSKINPETLLKNDIQLTLDIGTPQSSYNLTVQFLNPNLNLISSPKNNQIKTFNSSSSSSYKYLKDQHVCLHLFDSEELEEIANFKAAESVDIFNFAAYEMNTTFLLVNSSEDENSFNNKSGIFGMGLILSVDTASKTAVISKQLKENKIIEREIGFVKYTDNDNGAVVFGDYPHELYSAFHRETRKEVRTLHYSGQDLWGIRFDSLKFDSISAPYKIIRDAIFAIEYGYILAPKPLEVQVRRSFFDKYLKNGLCVEHETEEPELVTFNCVNNGKVDFKSFPAIEFYNRAMNMTFTLRGEDLFEFDKDRAYFLVYFNIIERFDSYWILGKPFLKKYTIYFDYSKNAIGAYDEVHYNSAFNYVWILFFISLIIIIVLTAFVLKLLDKIFKMKKKRKKSIYELEDGFDYVPYNSN